MAAKSRYFNISQDYSCKHQNYGFNLLNMHRVHNILFSVKRSSFIIFCILRHYPGLIHLPCLLHYLLYPPALSRSLSFTLSLSLSPVPYVIIPVSIIIPVSFIIPSFLHFPLSPLLSPVSSIIPCLLYYPLSPPLYLVFSIIPCLLHYPLSPSLSPVFSVILCLLNYLLIFIILHLLHYPILFHIFYPFSICISYRVK